MPTKKKTKARKRRPKTQDFQIVIVKPKMTFDAFAEHIWEICEDCALFHSCKNVWVIDVHHESKSMRDALISVLGYLKQKKIEVSEIRMSW